MPDSFKEKSFSIANDCPPNFDQLSYKCMAGGLRGTKPKNAKAQHKLSPTQAMLSKLGDYIFEWLKFTISSLIEKAASIGWGKTFGQGLESSRFLFPPSNLIKGS